MFLDAASRFLMSFFTSTFQVLYTVSKLLKTRDDKCSKNSVLDDLYFSVNTCYTKIKPSILSCILIHTCEQKYVHTNTNIKLKLEIF